MLEARRWPGRQPAPVASETVRTLLSAVLTLVSIVAIVVAVPSLWVKERLVDSEGFVATASAAAKNQEVKDYLAEQIGQQAASRVGIPAASLVIEPIAKGYTNGPQFESDFVDVVSQQHSYLFDEPKPGTENSTMELDITEMVNRVISQSGASGRVAGPILIPLADGGTGLEAGRYHQVGQQIVRLAYGSLVVAVIAGLLALLVARRRGTVLAWLGLGLVLGGATAWVVGVLIADRAKQEASAADASGRAVTDVIIDGAVGNLQDTALVVGAVGAGVVVVGILARLIFGGRSARA
ncbi:hypothetical protein GS4_32_00600 [Gordonia soli NBRC 108243]|uniref:Uncharacterized protein n=1 Tax=Gordonia soli NBRC 108243 TaxID=1223545 RepID=M0QPB1_9ACTN|nr:hypothetical protein GS4_32_00600 [Gordonia soli NBRC 108243]